MPQQELASLGTEFVGNSPCSNYPSHLTWQHSNQISKLIFTLLNMKNKRQKTHRILCMTHFQLCVNNLAQRHNFAIKEEYLHVFSPHSVEHPNDRLIALNNAAAFLPCLLSLFEITESHWFTNWITLIMTKNLEACSLGPRDSFYLCCDNSDASSNGKVCRNSLVSSFKLKNKLRHFALNEEQSLC